MKSLRIFISSPGDVSEERQITGKVIERLQGKYWSFVRLDDVFWERRAIRATAHYQDELIQPGNCDLVVGLLWCRLGSPLPKKFARFADAAVPTGTEWELEEAFDAYEANRAKLEKAGRDPQQASREAKPDILIYRRKPAPDRTTLETARLSQLDQLEAYLQKNYFNDDGTIKRPILGFKDLSDFEKKLTTHLEELILRQIPEVSPGFEPPPISGSPFKGLQAFDFKDSDRYFGRNRDIRELQHQLVASAQKGLPFMLIYGGSGFGKSSIMRAGLAPVLTRPGGSLDTISGWRRVPFQPAVCQGPLIERFVRALLQPPTPEEAEHSRLNDHWPLTGLAELGGREIDGTTWDAAALVRHLSDDEQRIFAISAIVETLESLDRHLLLEIDQLEELFTTSNFDTDQRSIFLNTVGDLCLTRRVWTVATMRSEFFPRIAEQSELFDLVGKDRGYILPPPDRQSLREIIRYPALAARIDFEQRIQKYKIAGENAKHDHLHDQILADAESSPDALPLLEFTLQQLYDERRGDFLTWDSYADAGGLKGAIAKRATEIYQALPAHAREACQRVFAALVHIDPAKGTITRQRAPLNPLKTHPGTKAFLKSFLDAHLLVTDEDGHTNEPVVTLAHEALITHWDELAQWIKEHRDDLLASQRLTEQTQLWVQNEEKKSFLLSEARLAEAERVAESKLFTFWNDQARFIKLSRSRARGRQRLLKGSVILFAGLAATAGIFGWISEDRRKLAQQKTTEALEANAKNAANLASASNADLAAALKAMEEDLKARQNGTRITGFGGRSQWYEAVALLARSLERNPQNTRSLHWLRETILRRGYSHWDLPLYIFTHEGVVFDAIYSPDDTRILTISSMGTAQVWDAATGKAIGEPMLHEYDVKSVAISPCGNRIVTVSNDNSARVWDLKTGKAIGEPIHHDNDINSAVFSPDGSSILSASRDKTARLWDANTGGAIREPLHHNGNVDHASFSPDGSRILTGSWLDCPQIWDAATGAHLGELTGAGLRVTSAVFSPDGDRILTASFGKMQVWDAVTAEAVGDAIHTGQSVTIAVFSPDGCSILTTCEDYPEVYTVQVWNASTGKAISRPMIHQGYVKSAVFSFDGSRILTTSLDETARVWKASSGEAIGEPMHNVRRAVFSVDGSRILTANSDGTAQAWAIGSSELMGVPLRHHFGVSSVAFSPDGNLILSTSLEGTCQLWNTATGKMAAAPMRHEHEVECATFSPDGSHILTATGQNTVWIWDAVTGEMINKTIRTEHGVHSVICSPDGKHILTAGYEYTQVLNAATGETIGEPIHHGDHVVSAVFSPDGRYILIASLDKTVRIWDITTRESIGKPMRHNQVVNNAVYNPNGTRILTSSVDGTAQVWDATTGEPIGKPMRHNGDVKTAVFSPDGSRILTASVDNTAQLWDSATNKAIGDPLRHWDNVTSAIFSPDGDRILTSSDDNTARVWDANTGEAISESMNHVHASFRPIFSPDGSHILTAKTQNIAQVWTSVINKDTYSMRLTEMQHKMIRVWALAISGIQFDEQGRMVTIPTQERLTGLTPVIGQF